MITVYDKFAADFSTLGLGAIRPTECKIEEEAGGMYELKVVHPICEDGRHERIEMLNIIKAPAPVRETPLIELDQTGGAGRDIYRVATAGERLNMRAGPGFNYRVMHAYPPRTEVAKLGQDGDWMQVAIVDGGATGWMAAENLEFVRTETAANGTAGGVIRPRQTREQLFRIYSIDRDSKLRTITARARHITYDLCGAVVVGEYSPDNVPASAVCAELMSRADHDISAFNVYCAVDAPISGKYEGRNIINCLLDTEDGIAAQADAMVIRDNYDIFILPRNDRLSNVRLRYGKNILSASLQTDASDMYTRIRPVGKDENGERLTLPENNGFVDSPRIGDYPVIYAKESEYDVVVSEDVTKAQALTRLRSKARADLAGMDKPEVRLDAEFVRLELTDKYRDLANAYALHLYDRVPVTDTEAAISATVSMTRYIFDCMLNRYEDTQLGEAQIDQDQPTETMTAEYVMLHSDSYAGGGWSYFGDDDIRQGMINDTHITGCMWFDNDAIRAELAGKKVVEAWLRICAQSGVGRGVDVEVELYGTKIAYNDRSGKKPALTAGYGLIGMASPGEVDKLPVPAQAIDDLANGVIKGLALYSSDDKLHDGETFSRNYARFHGQTSGGYTDVPMLTVVYQ